MSPLLSPQDPGKVEKFMQSVQPNATVYCQMKDTARQVAGALGSVAYMPVAAAKHTLNVGKKATMATARTAVAPISAAAAVPESASYLTANVTGLMPVVSNKIGKYFSSFRSGVGNLFRDRGGAEVAPAGT